MPSTFGQQTATIILHTEEDKTTLELPIGISSGSTLFTLTKGQPVKLDSLGCAIPFVSGSGQDSKDLCIGFVYVGSTPYGTGGGGATTATIWTRGYAILNCISTGSITPGPATINGMASASTTKFENESGVQYPIIAAPQSGNTDQLGWALDVASGTGQLVRLLFKD